MKGSSILMNLFYFNLINDFVVDYMHAILLGVTKLHMEYLFHSTKKKECWIGMIDSIVLKNLTDAIGSRLLSIQPPSGIIRSHSINDCCKWKALEWRS